MTGDPKADTARPKKAEPNPALPDEALPDAVLPDAVVPKAAVSDAALVDAAQSGKARLDEPQVATPVETPAESSTTSATSALLVPPPLPARWVDMRPVLALGTGLWFLAFCGLLVARYGYQTVTGIWLPTCLAGWILGLIGTAIMYWQQAAARRGSRGAQKVS